MILLQYSNVILRDFDDTYQENESDSIIVYNKTQDGLISPNSTQYLMAKCNEKIILHQTNGSETALATNQNYDSLKQTFETEEIQKRLAKSKLLRGKSTK
ncbi:hypothetical protein NBRC110019_31820 [Neptunitalea chrysea]|uniref:Uncharacterized protein n=1 Tax=Neptunitalea chrysea TaxID=1647581 RepID=A0A9W6EWC9_9FLAO|nr:hypothetical protein [Neptunitalea chrysea]GLB54141.1 hypothetical protein NBRC110019_31820 [Neptunitalea chrysea]